MQSEEQLVGEAILLLIVVIVIIIIVIIIIIIIKYLCHTVHVMTPTGRAGVGLSAGRGTAGGGAIIIIINIITTTTIITVIIIIIKYLCVTLSMI